MDGQNSQYCATRTGPQSNNSPESKDACSTLGWLLVRFVAFCLFLKVCELVRLYTWSYPTQKLFFLERLTFKYWGGKGGAIMWWQNCSWWIQIVTVGHHRVAANVAHVAQSNTSRAELEHVGGEEIDSPHHSTVRRCSEFNTRLEHPQASGGKTSTSKGF